MESRLNYPIKIDNERSRMLSGLFCFASERYSRDYYCRKFSECASMFAMVNMRWIFVYGAMLLLCAHGAYAGGGKYQRTKDGKALVWNNHPLPGDAATWSGDRDPEKYATGYGTLTWSRRENKSRTGSNIPIPQHIELTRYSGMMIRGRLDGPVVNVDANGKTFHGTFADGRKTKDWAAGPAPSASSSQEESVQPAAGSDVAANQQHNDSVNRDTVVEVPAEGPSRNPVLPRNDDSAARQSDRTDIQQPDHNISAPPIAITETPHPAVDDSLRSLMSPPSLLRKNPGAEPSPQGSILSTSSSPSPPARPRLSAADVIELADAEARAQGFDLGEYQHPQARYSAADGTWSVLYELKSVDSNAMGGVDKPFSVSVEEKTKKTSIVPER
jgi:hypothetical protein